MPTQSALEKRVARIDRDVVQNRRDTEGQFAQLRNDFAELGKDLGGRMDDMSKGFQAQIDRFTLDKVRAEGKAEGLAEAKKPNPWAIAVVPMIVAAVLSAVITWAGHDLVNGAGHAEAAVPLEAISPHH